MWWRLLVSVLLLVATPSWASTTQQVLLATDDATLIRAVEDALAPWQLDLVVVIGNDVRNERSARQRAEQVRASAVVWFQPAQATSATLHMYDRHSGRIAVVAVPAAPPYDELSAAAIALNVKTLLLHSQVAPVTERLDMQEPESSPSWLLALGGGAHGTPRSLKAWRPRLALRLLWRSRAWLHATLAYEHTNDSSVENTSFSGREDEQALSAAIGATFRLDTLAVSADLGLALRRLTLEGQALASPSSSELVRYNPAIELAGTAHQTVFRGLGLAVRARSGVLLRRQEILAGTERVHRSPRIDLGLEAMLVVAFF